MSQPISAIPLRRVQFFTGKGGVGKSTIVAASAVALAKRGLRPVIVETAARSSFAHLFGVERVDHTATDVGHGVFAVRVRFREALRRYLTRRLRSGALAQAVSINPALHRFFAAAPGVLEIAAMDAICELSRDSDYDVVLVDAEASGHVAMMFDLPAVFEEFLTDGPLRSVLDDMRQIVRDPAKSCVQIVTLPLALAGIETRELCTRLRDQSWIHLGGLVVNRMPTSTISPDVWSKLQALDEVGANHADVALAHDEDGRLRLAAGLVDSLRDETALPVMQIPEIEHIPIPGPKFLETVADMMEFV